jgi:hypothetical protein
LSSFSEIDSELGLCIAMLYITPWIYYILGIYLYEVIPQQYGVRKHPLFFINSIKKLCCSKKVHHKRDSLLEHDKLRISDINDDEIINDLKIIKELKEDELENYPLVVNELTKVNEFYI